MEVCPICQTILADSKPATNQGTIVYFRCGLCGTLGVMRYLASQLSSLPLPQKRQILQWLRDPVRNETCDTPLITPALLESGLAKYRALRVTEMAERLLRFCVTEASMGHYFDLTEKGVLCAAYALNRDECAGIVEYLVERNFAQFSGDKSSFRIRANGFSYIEEGGLVAFDSNQAFVAMCFAEDLTEAFSAGICPAIEINGFDPLRIDSKEHNRKIDDEIVAELRRSKFVVADFTKHRGGVYFEAGFAMGLGLPIIWTCRRDDMQDLHFDIRQYNCIDWECADDLRARLSNRIGALIGRGRNRTS